MVCDTSGRKGLPGPHPSVKQEALVLFEHLIKVLGVPEAELQVPSIALRFLELVEGGAAQALIHETLLLQGFNGLHLLLPLVPELLLALLLSPAPAGHRDLGFDLGVWVERLLLQVRHEDLDLAPGVALAAHQEALIVVVVAVLRLVGVLGPLDDGLHNPRHIIHLYHPTLHTGLPPAAWRSRFRPYSFS